MRAPAESVATGVGSKDPESLPSVAPANVGASQHSPLRIEPDGGKVGEDGVEPEREMAPDVLKECVSGS